MQNCASVFQMEFYSLLLLTRQLHRAQTACIQEDKCQRIVLCDSIACLQNFV